MATSFELHSHACTWIEVRRGLSLSERTGHPHRLRARACDRQDWARARGPAWGPKSSVREFDVCAPPPQPPPLIWSRDLRLDDHGLWSAVSPPSLRSRPRGHPSLISGKPGYSVFAFHSSTLTAQVAALTPQETAFTDLEWSMCANLPQLSGSAACLSATLPGGCQPTASRISRARCARTEPGLACAAPSQGLAPGM